ncbi:D-alanyl-D-alanine carboxypeptidase/D-alanyl-D-alanine endopeptidase [Demequina mangrovi]|uniref:D-alanyl-D-alanine carboxypeptidase / D-alanyl-D-alanine-endopeptidase (Penicillin-binding protein 4) n=1 Tax=Demequina mangrovi TaxID=1043493 RepID=A0A1H6YSA4_9MICO|nr:D-alanyl-D-alanine carboxypeptidase/D-alanyl-D-alanine-endopeptidase [Demequina mangrovi]SEJ39605.1 D-alanyl-D-alanine carboxypeptidase / D-alanyl-D-alanine-endopeptidase (penicillin-binding protein 4) [Demequina mangrovi]
MRRAIAWVMVSILVLAGGYVYADAQDWVPGWFTAEPFDVPQAPFVTQEPVAVASPSGTDAVARIDTDAPRPSAAEVQALAEQVRADSRTGASTNISVVDYLDGTVYADVSAADPQVPASTTKLITVVAAVAELGADFTTTTTVAWVPRTRTLTLVAGGDVLLAADQGHHGDVDDAEDAAQGWAGLGDLADQVVEALADSLGEDVIVQIDDSDFPGPAWPAEWPQYAFDMGYAAPVTGLAVDGARLTDDNYAKRASDPSVHAGELFVEALEARGVAVDGEVTRASSPVADDARGREVASVDSAPLSEIARHLLSVSDNTVAEQVARVLAIEAGRKATPTGEAKAIIASLRELGVDVTGLELHDGAGYSERNQISPATMTSALLAARDEPALEGLLDWLPLAGLEGTVATRYEGLAPAGYWRAKTGSLTGVTSIAGVVVTADGRPLAVAILADGMPYGQEAPKAAFDDLLVALAECGCEG